jgi:uncharacterized protein YfiM (DUF2279 family)
MLSGQCIASANDSLTVTAYEEFDKNDLWLGEDKGYHFIGSMILTVGIIKALEQSSQSSDLEIRNKTVLISFSIGLGKEIWDGTKKRNYFSYKDMIANITGILTGVLITK